MQKKNSKIRNGIALLLFTGISAAFIAGASYLIYLQREGVPTEATVNYCTQLRRSEVCHGTWFVNGKFVSGTIENVTSDDIGSKVEVRAIGDSAIKPGLRLPIVLYAIGLLFSFMGWTWWMKEAKH